MICGVHKVLRSVSSLALSSSNSYLFSFPQSAPSRLFSSIFSTRLHISSFIYEYGKTWNDVALIAIFWVTHPFTA